MSSAARNRRIVLVLAGGLMLVALAVGVSRWRSPAEKPGRNEITRLKLEALGRWCFEFRQQLGALPKERIWSRELALHSLGDGDFLDNDNRGFLKQFYDAWDRPFQYRCPGRLRECSFDLYSVGPNGLDDRGEGDDISYWDVVDSAREMWAPLLNDSDERNTHSVDGQ